MATHIPAQGLRSDTDVVYEAPAVRENWIFPMIAGALGVAVFLVGLVAVFRVSFEGNLFATTGEVMGYGFSAVLAVATLLLGGGTLIAAIADRDQGATAFMGILTMVLAIVAMIANGRVVEQTAISVDREAALALAVAGAAIFIVGLVPWVSVRRRQTVVHYDA